MHVSCFNGLGGLVFQAISTTQKYVHHAIPLVRCSHCQVFKPVLNKNTFRMVRWQMCAHCVQLPYSSHSHWQARSQSETQACQSISSNCRICPNEDLCSGTHIQHRLRSLSRKMGHPPPNRSVCKISGSLAKIPK